MEEDFSKALQRMNEAKRSIPHPTENRPPKERAKETYESSKLHSTAATRMSPPNSIASHGGVSPGVGDVSIQSEEQQCRPDISRGGERDSSHKVASGSEEPSIADAGGTRGGPEGQQSTPSDKVGGSRASSSGNLGEARRRLPERNRRGLAEVDDAEDQPLPKPNPVGSR